MILESIVQKVWIFAALWLMAWTKLAPVKKRVNPFLPLAAHIKAGLFLEKDYQKRKFKDQEFPWRHL